MNKVLRLFLFLFLAVSCSLDQKSGIWTKVDKIENDKDFVIVELFKEEKNLYKTNKWIIYKLFGIYNPFSVTFNPFI